MVNSSDVLVGVGSTIAANNLTWENVSFIVYLYACMDLQGAPVATGIFPNQTRYTTLSTPLTQMTNLSDRRMKKASRKRTGFIGSGY